MIYFIVQRWHDYTMRNFLDAWGQSVRARVKIVDYDYLALTRKLPFGTYVFTDHDRMTEAQTEMASAVADQLVAAGPAAAKVLSHPRTTLSRVPFLRAMNELGINDFRVFRVALEPLPADLKFPVFLRLSNNHKGGLTEPLHTRAELDQAIAASEHKTSPHLLVCEFCDTADEFGVFHKYGALRIGDAIAPRHVFASKHWMTKLNPDVDEPWLAIEAEFFRRFDDYWLPRIRPIFEAAGVGYGRLDFSLAKDGSIRAWEINTNCMLTETPDVIDERRLVTQSRSARLMVAALRELDEQSPKPNNGDRIRVEIDEKLRQRAGVTTADRYLRHLGRGLNRLMNLPPTRTIVDACSRARWLAHR